MPESRKDQVGVCYDSFDEDHLHEYSQRVAEILGISNPKFRINSFTKEGDNWLGIIYRVLFEGQKNGVPVKISTILKVPPQDELARKTGQVDHLFPREEIFYSVIVPVFNEFVKAHNRNLENIPKCYFSSSVHHKEAICLEDLQPLGFVMRDRIKQLDFAHMSLTFRALGRFHALSFALRDQKPEVFMSKIATLKEPLFRPDLINNAVVIDFYKKFGKLPEMALAEEDPRYAKRFTDFLMDVLNHVGRSCQGNLAEPYAVLTHGDFWTNNLLYKYEKDSTEPQDVYFLDFQMSRYASPATDISYILFSCCNQDLRDKHFDELLKIYHESLSAHLSDLGSDPKKLFPFEALLDQLLKFSAIAVGVLIIAFPNFTGQGDDIKEIRNDDSHISALMERLHRDHFWRNNLRDSVKDMIDRNYI